MAFDKIKLSNLRAYDVVSENFDHRFNISNDFSCVVIKREVCNFFHKNLNELRNAHIRTKLIVEWRIWYIGYIILG